MRPQEFSCFSLVDLVQLRLTTFYGLEVTLQLDVLAQLGKALVQIKLLSCGISALSDLLDLVGLDLVQEFWPHFPALEVVDYFFREIAVHVQKAHPRMAQVVDLFRTRQHKLPVISHKISKCGEAGALLIDELLAFKCQCIQL